MAVPVGAGIAPNDAVLNFILQGLCKRNAAVIREAFVFDDGAVVKVGSALDKATTTSISCVVGNQTVPEGNV